MKIKSTAPKEKKPKNKGTFKVELPNRKIVSFLNAESHSMFHMLYAGLRLQPSVMYRKIYEIIKKAKNS